MNTAEYIVTDITRTVLYLAGIGAGLKVLLALAPRFQIAAPKAPQQPKRDTGAEAPKAGPAAEPGAEVKDIAAREKAA